MSRDATKHLIRNSTASFSRMMNMCSMYESDPSNDVVWDDAIKFAREEWLDPLVDILRDSTRRASARNRKAQDYIARIIKVEEGKEDEPSQTSKGRGEHSEWDDHHDALLRRRAVLGIAKEMVDNLTSTPKNEIPAVLQRIFLCLLDALTEPPV